MVARSGSGLIELIVALTVFTVGLLGLAGAAAVAHRSFTEAGLIERTVEVTGALIDSLLRISVPSAGERQLGQLRVDWTIAADSTMRTLRVTAAIPGEPPTTYTVIHSERPR